ncbi:PPOX class F420-dependent oxidoreductase [Pseudonocardia sp. GCM10023141]|uniref:PPOX class F420-dependent oxidoreductase n=1 Tax=Pseudonocardia sp. GCM10023141 TaxID=3252653 RepID=UPI00361F23D8
MSPTSAAALGSAQYVQLTTFRKDGRAVPTTVWVAPLDGRLGVWTVADSGKVKRIHRNGAVTVAACDRRGTLLGAAVPATATVLDEDGSTRVRHALRRKYGAMGRIAIGMSILRRGKAGSVGLQITPT